MREGVCIGRVCEGVYKGVACLEVVCVQGVCEGVCSV